MDNIISFKVHNENYIFLLECKTCKTKYEINIKEPKEIKQYLNRMK
jgi:hypothetical protein